MRSLEVELEARVEQALVPHLLPLLLIRLCTACPAQVSVLIQGAFHAQALPQQTFQDHGHQVQRSSSTPVLMVQSLVG